MKLKYILGLFLSALFIAGCSEDAIVGTLDNISVSQTYVTIDSVGGDATVTITAKQAWKMEKVFSTITKNADGTKDTTWSEVPSWLTVSKVSGEAGQQEITFHAAQCAYGRECELQITCGDKTQFLNVRQGNMAASSATCAEVIAGADGKTYQVTGSVTAIANTTYGYWYLNDGTGEVYIYGTLDADGAAKNFTSLGIEVGDVVTVQGPKSTYGSTVELVDVTVVKIEKALLNVVSSSTVSFTSDGGTTVMKVAYKGSGVYVNIPEDCSWVTLKNMEYISGIPTKLESSPADTALITLSVAANQASARTANITVTSSKTEYEYNKAGQQVATENSTTGTVVISQLGLSGTEDRPFTVEEAIAYANNLGGESTSDYYIKGKVSKIASAFGAQYGNGTFWISDDGTYNEDTALDFEVYRALWLGNQKWVDGNAALSEGDEVVICGHITLYKGTAETASGKAYVYSVNGCQTDENGLGSEAAPFNALGAIAAANAGYTGNVYIQGIVSQFVSNGEFGSKFGNGSFWISTDGVYNNDKSKDFEVYRALWLENQKWADGDYLLAVGDKVVVYGALTTYNGTAETSSGKAYVVSYTSAN